jgi:hypothetical protein
MCGDGCGAAVARLHSAALRLLTSPTSLFPLCRTHSHGMMELWPAGLQDPTGVFCHKHACANNAAAAPITMRRLMTPVLSALT